MDDELDQLLETLLGAFDERLTRLEQAVTVLLEERERRMPGRRFDHLLNDDQRLQIAAAQQRMRERRAPEQTP